jgi:hypothetical protein
MRVSSKGTVLLACTCALAATFGGGFASVASADQLNAGSTAADERSLIVVRGMRPSNLRFNQLTEALDAGLETARAEPGCSRMACAFLVEFIDGAWRTSNIRIDEERYLLELQADLAGQDVVFVMVHPTSSRQSAVSILGAPSGPARERQANGSSDPLRPPTVPEPPQSVPRPTVVIGN